MQLNRLIKLENIALLILLLMVFILGIKRIYSPDLGFHLASGEWMLEQHRIMKQEVFTYTIQNSQYLDLNWLYQVTLYIIYKFLGTGGLVLLNALLITISFILLIIRLQLKENPRFYIAVWLLIMGALVISVEIRPHVISWLFLNLTLLVLEKYKYQKVNRLYWLPVIMMLWINFHSLAVLGLLSIGTYLIGYYLEYKKLDRQLLLFFFLSVGSIFFNPFFAKGLLFPFKQFFILTGNDLKSVYISELQSPFTIEELKIYGAGYILRPLFWLQCFVAISFFAGLRSMHRKAYTSLLTLGVFTILLIFASKNFGYFFFATLPGTITYLGSKNQKKPISPNPVVRSTLRPFLVSCSIAIFIILTTLNDGLELITGHLHRFGTEIDQRHLPKNATDFLVQNNIKGKVLNHLDFGGYLSFFYGEKIFIDGRLELIEDEFFKEYFESRINPDGLEKLISKHKPDIIIFPYLKSTEWWVYMMKRTDWKVVYVDWLSIVYVHKNRFPELTEISESVLLEKIPGYNKDQLNKYLQITKPSRFKAILGSILKKQIETIEYEYLSMYCFTMDYSDAALAYSFAAIDQATVSPSSVYFNLYRYYSEQKEDRIANLFRKKSGK